MTTTIYFVCIKKRVAFILHKIKNITSSVLAVLKSWGLENNNNNV